MTHALPKKAGRGDSGPENVQISGQSCGRRTAEQGDEMAAPHSITSSRLLKTRKPAR
jgi:hypothetical protein